MTSRLFCCMIFLCKGLHLPHNPLLRHFLQVPLKKTPTPFGVGGFLLHEKHFWKNQVEGALKEKKGSFENGIEMLYPTHARPHARTRATAGTVTATEPGTPTAGATTQAGQERQNRHRRTNTRTEHKRRPQGQKNRPKRTERPPDKHSLLVIDIYIIHSNK